MNKANSNHAVMCNINRASLPEYSQLPSCHARAPDGGRIRFLGLYPNINKVNMRMHA